MIRPERVRGGAAREQTAHNRAPGLVEHAVFLGSFRELRVRILGGSLIKAIAAERRGTRSPTSREPP